MSHAADPSELDPAPCADCSHLPQLETVVESRTKDLGGIAVRRVLPAIARRHVGPFIFFDHFGGATGAGAPAPPPSMQVRPHPHINLATVSYLFEGGILHRDSLGYTQVIRPGAVNWMTAGRGIVHSERMPDEPVTGLHGIQVWLGLPTQYEEVEPSFEHYPEEVLPTLEQPGVSLRLLAGAAYGERSPVTTLSPLFYLDARLSPGAELSLPSDYSERAVYVASGQLAAPDDSPSSSREIGVGQMAVFSGGGGAVVRAVTEARVMLLGGEPLDGERLMWWNFVSSSAERMQAAKAEWANFPAEARAGSTGAESRPRFGLIPGDDTEFIPLPSA